ncbi:20S-pre-rRNA D-site endonuclease nob1 [Linderina macrospora]|uniref:20S-pre-rRNA D-site endonuclease nob1 n=1 Tax=Linderina macrospora TaxID=4868 RepID=A0ACC1JF65_9FUNG|nr:20S-pre-rRNA D-site endonuclease nob1 [Linderina macrospora]
MSNGADTAAATTPPQAPTDAQPVPVLTYEEKLKLNNNKPVVTLVVDTNPFIKGLPLDHIANKFVTIPEVLGELRSRAAKDRYQSLDLKHGIEVIEPDAESMSAVVGFAKKTGDYASLAMADLKVVALAFMLEKRANGMRRLRLEPVGSQPNIADRKLMENAVELVGNGDNEEIKEEETEEQEVKEAEKEVEQLDNKIQDLSVESNEEEDAMADAVLTSAAKDEFEVGSDEEFDDEEEEEEEEESDSQQPAEEDDDDGWEVAGPKKTKKAPRKDDFFNGEWITPSNVKLHLAANAMGMKNALSNRPQSIFKVACVTSDFAMQNVILKMGINLVTPDGIAVRRLRTWVLRCHACFALTGDMNKQFCPACGHPTLKRCSVTTGTNGQLQVHLKKDYRYNLRGTVYSMPKPHGGKHTIRDVITREDDKAYRSAVRYKQIKESKANSGLGGVNSLLDPDFIPDLLIGNSLADSKGYGVATDARGMPMVARNRKNPNAVKRTGNRKHKRQDF